MNYILAVFQTRFSTLSFANALRKNNIPFAVINTPYELKQTCGISVKFLGDYFSFAQNLLSHEFVSNHFYGFFEYVYNGRTWVLQRK